MRLREMIGLIEDHPTVISTVGLSGRSSKRVSGTQTIPIPLDFRPKAVKPSEIGGKMANKDTASTRASTRKIPVIKTSDIADAWTDELKKLRK